MRLAIGVPFLSILCSLVVTAHQAPVPQGRSTWTAFSGEYKISSGVGQSRQEVTGRYYRASSGSHRSELDAPQAARAFFRDPDLVFVDIANADLKMAFHRVQAGRWYSYPLPTATLGVFEARLQPKQEHLRPDGELLGFPVFRRIQPGSNRVEWLAEELNFFSLRTLEGTRETVYTQLKRGEPLPELFSPPSGASVEAVGTVKEFVEKSSRIGGL